MKLTAAGQLKAFDFFLRCAINQQLGFVGREPALLQSFKQVFLNAAARQRASDFAVIITAE